MEPISMFEWSQRLERSRVDSLEHAHRQQVRHSRRRQVDHPSLVVRLRRALGSGAGASAEQASLASQS